MEEEKILYRKIHNIRIAVESIIGVIKLHDKNLSMSPSKKVAWELKMVKN